MECHIQIYFNGQWQTAAIFEPDLKTLDQGIAGGCRLQYDIDYAVANHNSKEAELTLGLTVGFELYRFKQWPPFIVDLLPGGAGRQAWLKRLQIAHDGPQADWHLLTKGAGNPPGNLRILEAVLPPPPAHFKIGFPRRDIIEQRETFLDYAEERGAHVAGATSVQGEAPKYLLVEDRLGMFHAVGALPDEKAMRFWLIKFPRGRRSHHRNQMVLRNEAPYLEVARKFGVITGAPLVYEDDTLFVPRFDRVVKDGRVKRLGMQSLYTIANVFGFGKSVHHDIFCLALAQTATDPSATVREYILRDVLNLALRNTDNHGRNSAIIRSKGWVGLSPLFDFAPMFLDPEGISRVSRWENERPGSQPDWGNISEKLADVMPPEETRKWLAQLAKPVKKLPEIMQECQVDDEIIERLENWVSEVALGLLEAQPGSKR